MRHTIDLSQGCISHIVPFAGAARAASHKGPLLPIIAAPPELFVLGDGQKFGDQIVEDQGGPTCQRFLVLHDPKHDSPTQVQVSGAAFFPGHDAVQHVLVSVDRTSDFTLQGRPMWNQVPLKKNYQALLFLFDHHIYSFFHSTAVVDPLSCGHYFSRCRPDDQLAKWSFWHLSFFLVSEVSTRVVFTFFFPQPVSYFSSALDLPQFEELGPFKLSPALCYG